MTRTIHFAIAPLLLTAAALAHAADAPIGEPGMYAQYALDGASKASNVVELTVALGPVESLGDAPYQWLHLDATKGNGDRLRIWLLCDASPSEDLDAARETVARYIVQRGEALPQSFRHAVTQWAVLPSSGAWPFLLPRGDRAAQQPATDPLFPERVEYLGLPYRRTARSQHRATPPPAERRVIELRPDVLVGVPHNTRQADETRRFDDSEYEYIPLTDADFDSMMAAGINCFFADLELAKRFDAAGVFYWGTDAAALPYPECLYNPCYLGPALFLDEPAVVTRDHALRPKLAEDPAFRQTITPQDGLKAFEEHYQHVIAEGAPTIFAKQLAGRIDADAAGLQFVQPNIYSWETMVSSAAYQLGYNAETPGAIVFEPPGQVGARRLLPGMNMAYGCQIPVTGTDHFIDIIIGYLRGAARATGKEWGISIYGSVDRSDAFAFMRRAYDLGATRFFYWDGARLACVPFGEVLDLSGHLRVHAGQYPERDLDELLHAAEVAILLPSGYNLGHVHMGRGLIWGVPELNLERRNRAGVPYRTVMGNFFTEIERCIRQGVAFDLLWDLDGLTLDGYREIVRVREDGKVEVMDGESTTLLNVARTPDRAAGQPPQLSLTVSASDGKAPFSVAATAQVVKGSAPIYFSHQPDKTGVHHNDRVAWELYGPNDEDYTYRGPVIVSGEVTPHEDGGHLVTATIRIEKPGAYRLRAATTDLTGRSAVAWHEITVTE